LTKSELKFAKIFEEDSDGAIAVRDVAHINGYLVAGSNVVIVPANRVSAPKAPMRFGNHPYYANALMLSPHEVRQLLSDDARVTSFIRPLYGSQEFISGVPRYCLWITPDTFELAREIPSVKMRIEQVRQARIAKNKDIQAQRLVETPFQFREQYEAENHLLVVPIVSSEERPYLPVGIFDRRVIIHNRAFAHYDAPLWSLSIIASRLHLIWISTVCGKLEMRFVYSNTLGWNTFPLPILTEQNKVDLACCAEDILLAREAHFPATIADLYDPEVMPEDLRCAHERNDETLERIYIGRRFRNDTERLERLFELYTKMTSKGKAA
jgi:hypothetical protein